MVSLGNINIKDICLGSTEANAAYLGTTKLWPTTQPAAYAGLCFTGLQDNSTVQLAAQGSPHSIQLQTSTDGTTWNSYTVGTSITLNEGDKVYFAAPTGVENEGFFDNDNNYYHMAGTGKYSASGCIHSLLTHDISQKQLVHDCYGNFFLNNTALVDANGLDINAESVTWGTYNCCFKGCSNLEYGPAELEVDAVLSNYAFSGMFLDCINLTKAPVIGDVFAHMTAGVDRSFNATFMNCQKLAEMEVHFTTWTTANWQFNDWLRAASTTGTFKCPSALPAKTGTSAIPAGWTRVDI